MRAAQIEHVDVIANRGSVGRRIVRAVDFELRPLSLNRFECGRDQVRFRLVQFPDLAVRIGARRVEVARRNPLQAVRDSVPVQHASRRTAWSRRKD